MLAAPIEAAGAAEAAALGVSAARPSEDDRSGHAARRNVQLRAAINERGQITGTANSTNVFYVTTEKWIIQFDVTAWGWIHVVVGVLAVLAGIGLSPGPSGPAPSPSWSLP